MHRFAAGFMLTCRRRLSAVAGGGFLDQDQPDRGKPPWACYPGPMAKSVPVPVVAQVAVVREAHGGRVTPRLFIVAERDPAKAREILRGKLPGLHVEELYPLPSGCLE